MRQVAHPIAAVHMVGLDVRLLAVADDLHSDVGLSFCVLRVVLFRGFFH